MELHGTLRSWNDDKGFGFIRPASGGDDVFVHISVVRGDQRPRAGEAVSYVAGRDERGRLRAEHMRMAGALSLDDPAIRRRPAAAASTPSKAAPASTPTAVSARRRRHARQGIAHLPGKLVLFALFCLLPVWGGMQALALGVPWVGLAYVLASLISFAQYWNDKRNAQSGHWRTSEARLHFFELLGGWPGALAAQQVFRHKTRKVDFQLICWGIVAMHQAFWLERLLLGGRVLGPLGIPGL